MKYAINYCLMTFNFNYNLNKRNFNCGGVKKKMYGNVAFLTNRIFNHLEDPP